MSERKPIWNVRRAVVHLVEADDEIEAFRLLDTALSRAGFEPDDETSADDLASVFESESQLPDDYEGTDETLTNWKQRGRVTPPVNGIATTAIPDDGINTPDEDDLVWAREDLGPDDEVDAVAQRRVDEAPRGPELLGGLTVPGSPDHPQDLDLVRWGKHRRCPPGHLPARQRRHQGAVRHRCRRSEEGPANGV